VIGCISGCEGEVLNGPSGEFEHRELRLTEFPKKEGGVREMAKCEKDEGEGI
jgi:hypothetical protein